MSLIIENIRLNSENKSIVDITDLYLPQSGMVLLCGPSGAGKSLILKSIAGLIKGTKWDSKIKITFQSESLKNRNGQIPIIGYIPQDLRLSFDQNRTIRYHINEALLSKETITNEHKKLLQNFDLPYDLLDKYPHECSGGQLQRILVFIADLHQPHIILADEAISALDSENELFILRYLKNQVYTRGSLAICVSHKYDLSIFDHLIYIEQGKIVINKPVESLSGEDKYLVNRQTSSTIKVASSSSEIIAIIKDGVLPYNLLSNISLNYVFHKGQSYGVFGKSGAGKTTFIKCLSGLLSLSSGKIEWIKSDDKSPFIQMVFQHPAASIHPSHSIQNYFQEYVNVVKQEYDMPVEELLPIFQLDNRVLSRLPSQLSGGELQRVSIIRALASKPKMILFDEAFASVDQSTIQIILPILSKLQAENGTTYVFVSHDLEFLNNTCGHIINFDS